MTPIERSGDDLPDNLPLLTQVVEEDSPDDIPILTEIVAEPESKGWQFTTLAMQENQGGTAEFVDEFLPVIHQENFLSDAVVADDDRFSLPESLEIETPSHSGENEAISIAPEANIFSPRPFSDAEMQQLLHQLETHMETVFKAKLSQQLEQLQQLAIQQAVNELKAELPELVRNALNTRPGL